MHYQIITSALWRFRTGKGKTAIEKDKSRTHTKTMTTFLQGTNDIFLQKEKKKTAIRSKQQPARPVMSFPIEWNHT